MRTIFSPEHALPNLAWISLNKPQQVINACWRTALEFRPSRPVTVEELRRVHTEKYINDVLSLKTNGFGVDYLNDRVLNQILHANGTMIEAVTQAFDERIPVFAPVSGFHHAYADKGGGFCTFNGLVVAAEALRSLHKDVRVLILDFDGHYGDGTASLIGSRSWIRHMTREDPFVEARPAIDLACQAIHFGKPDIILYQAGADSWVGDKFGAGYFSTNEWLERDARIFQTAKENGIPIVWNLAGGYNGKATVTLHAATFEIACRVFEPDLHDDAPILVEGLSQDLFRASKRPGQEPAE